MRVLSSRGSDPLLEYNIASLVYLVKDAGTDHRGLGSPPCVVLDELGVAVEDLKQVGTCAFHG